VTIIHIGRSFGHSRTSEAEHWLSELSQPVLAACTHFVRKPFAHVALSIEVAVPATFPAQPVEFREAALWASEQHRLRLSGRAFWYPGRDLMTGDLKVAEMLALSGIEAIKVLGGEPPQPDTVVETRDFVRPQWMDGKLTLVAAPAGQGRIAPFEVANPMDCCQDHF
jgi:hypothetical protein